MKRFLALSIAAIILSAYTAKFDAAAQTPEQAETVQAEEALPENGTEPSATVEAATPDRMWEDANALYMNNQYAEAAALYEKILDCGLFSDKLYYNLANACFRTGDNTRAILYYNRALLLSPNDDDIRHNLAIAESQTKDSIEEVPEFFLSSWTRGLRNMLDERMWTVLSLVLLAATLVLGVMFLLARRTGARKGAFFGMLAAILLCIAATSFAASQRNAILNRDKAIVMSSAAPVKSSPDRSATDLFVLHEGTKVRVTGTVNNWSEIVIADGKKGWIETDKIEVI